MSIRGKTTETSAPQRDLLGLTLTQLEAWFQELGEPPYRARQVYNWIYKHLVVDFSAMSNLPLSLRERLAREATIGQVIVRSEQRSKDDRTRKILLELADGRLIESVLMLYPPLGGEQRPRHRLRLQPGGLRFWLYLLCYGPDGL